MQSFGSVECFTPLVGRKAAEKSQAMPLVWEGAGPESALHGDSAGICPRLEIGNRWRRVPAMTQDGDGARRTVGGVTANNGERRRDENTVYAYQAGEHSIARTNRAPCSLQSACTSAGTGCRPGTFTYDNCQCRN